MSDKKYYIEPVQMLHVLQKRQRNIKVQVPSNLVVLLSGSPSKTIGNHEWSDVQNFFYMKIQHSKKNDLAVVWQLGFGSPAAALGLDLLIAAGARKMICFGTAGALTPKLESGQIIICDKAFRDDGVSRHYVEPSSNEACTHPDEELFQHLQSSCKELGLRAEIASSWTTDAIFRESIDEARKFYSLGAQCVEMEAAALFSVARCREVPLACLFAISDHLVEGEWEPNFQTALARYDDLMRVAIAALRR